MSFEDVSIIELPQQLSSLEPSAMIRMHMDPELEKRLYQLLDHLRTTEMEYFLNIKLQEQKTRGERHNSVKYITQTKEKKKVLETLT
jgi:hypothetical protein